MKDRNKKLKAIEKELNIKHVTKKGPVNKYAHVKGKLNESQLKKSEQEFNKLVDQIKTQLVNGKRQIIDLTTKKDQMQINMPKSGDINDALDSLHKELANLHSQQAEIQQNHIRDQTKFEGSKDFIEAKLSEVQDLQRDIQDIQHKNFSIGLRAQQAKELEQELISTRQERDQIETNITQLTQLHFNRDKDGPDQTANEISKKKKKLHEEETLLRKCKAEEEVQEEALKNLKERVQKMKGEIEFIKGEHHTAKEKFIETNQEISMNDLHTNLFSINKEKYAEALNDLSMKPDKYTPDIDLISRGDPNVKKDEKFYKKEIELLRHEKKDLAAEIDRVQRLVELQRDIEKESRQYKEQEKERVKLLAESFYNKAKDMQYKVKEQVKEIAKYDKSEKAKYADAYGRGGYEDDDELLRIEDDNFSVNSKDSIDENDTNNYIDLRIIGADLNSQAIEEILRKASYPVESLPKNLTTFVSVQFYNHGLQHTGVAYGVNPQYRTQISFKNQMSGQYVRQLEKDQIKFEVHMQLPGERGIFDLGSCVAPTDVFVREETVKSHQINGKPALFEYLLHLMQPGSKTVIGSLKVKMRLRKPIIEEFMKEKFFEKLEKSQFDQEREDKPMNDKRIVTINVVHCKNLRSAHDSDSSKLAPFFFYQFYTFPEVMSFNSSGSNPTFKNAQSYNLVMDPSSQSYLKKETLDIVFIDDNAPLNGLERGAQSNFGGAEDESDMIGRCCIKLSDLANDKDIEGDFPIVGPKSEDRGKAYVKITIVQPKSQKSQLTHEEQLKEQRELKYTSAWEQDVIMKIARKLSKLSLEVDLLFGVFSRGSKSCTREDFKYSCLQRLGLKSELAERELDQLFESSQIIRDKNNITQKEFVEIFSKSILKARDEALDEEEWNRQQIQRLYARQNEAMDLTQSLDKGSLQDLQRNEVVKIIVECFKNTTPQKLYAEVELKMNYDQIAKTEVIQMFQQIGMASTFDAQKVANYVAVGHHVRKEMIANVIQSAQLQAKQQSDVVHEFEEIVRRNAQSVSKAFQNADMNKDCSINSYGFKTAILDKIALQTKDKTKLIEGDKVEQIFALIATLDGNLNYAEYMIGLDDEFRKYFTQQQLDQSGILDQSRFSVRTDYTQDRHNQSFKESSSHTYIDAAREARKKIEDFIIKQGDVSIHVIFNVVDTNSDNELSKQEFRSKMRGLIPGIEDNELDAIFRELDQNNDGHITLKEFISTFSELNTDYVLKRLRHLIKAGTWTAESMYTKFCQQDSIKLDQFKQLVRHLIDNIADFEIELVFRDLDKNINKHRTSRGQLSREDFIIQFSSKDERGVSAVNEIIDIEDIFKPLNTYLKRRSIDVFTLFKKYDKDKNELLSVDELIHALQDYLQYDITRDEARVIERFFKAKYYNKEIQSIDFSNLLQSIQRVSRTAGVNFKVPNAKAALLDLQKSLNQKKLNIEQHLKPACSKAFPKEISLRAFKLKINELGCLTPRQLNNLAKYFDNRNNGLIHLSDVVQALNNPNFFKPKTIEDDYKIPTPKKK